MLDVVGMRGSKMPQDIRESVNLNGTATEPHSFTPFTPFTPFPKVLPSTQEFPVEAMPERCRALIREAASAIGCPPEFVALPMLVTLGSAIGNARRLKVKGGWTEGATVYAAVIAEPGDKKSPAQNVAVEPAMTEQVRLRKLYQDKLDEHKRELREYEVDRHRARKDEEAAPPPPQPPTMERTAVGDTTVEALARILEQNPRGVGVFRDELAAWVRSMDQYRAGGKGSDRQFWLSMWSNQPAQFDRKGQPEPVILHRPFAGVFGSIQPDVLPDLQNNRDDGLLERFVFAYPEPILSDWTEDEITADAAGRYANLYSRLRDLEMGTDEYVNPDPKVVNLSPDAKVVFIDAYNSHQEERRSPGFPRELRRAWPKLEGYLARFSLILALSRTATTGAAEYVEVQDVLAAEMLLRYFKNQAYRTYTALYGESPDDVLAYDLASFLADAGGTFEGSATELFEQFASEHKPGNPSWLTKKVQDIAAKTPSLGFTEGHESVRTENTKTGRSTRRVIRLTLGNGVNGVNGVNAWRGSGEGGEVRI